MTELLVSLVICSHNPRPEYLARTLEGLKKQTLPLTDWELVLVDNASQTPVASMVDLSWHPHSRFVVEKELGVTSARLCGIKTSRAPIIVWVDDDNILAPDYLTQALSIGREFPRLGTWGSADIRPEYEKAPAPEFEPFCSILALKQVSRDAWSNRPVISEALPYTAGMAMRRSVGEAYLAHRKKGGFVFGRSGTSLLGSEDYEIDLIATDNGYGYGVFRSLSIIHLISARRVERDYLLRLYESTVLSNLLLLLLRQEKPEAPRFGFSEKVREFLGLLFKLLRGPGAHRVFYYRMLVGKWKALRMYREIVAKQGSASETPGR